MKTLREYIEAAQPRRNQQSWADELGTPRTYFSQILNGTKRPGRKLIGRINTMTRGAVPPQVWFLDDLADDITDPPPVVADPAGNAPQNGGRR